MTPVTTVAVRSVWRSHVGRVRAINEDRVFDHPGAGVWAVADGMGGHDGGDLAAEQVVAALRRATQAGDAVGPWQVRDALIAAHEAIRQRNQLLRLNAGTTVVAATLTDEAIEIMWAGDCRAYRLHEGAVEQLTTDHSFVQELVDAGRLSPAAAPWHPEAHVVTRALGVSDALLLDRVRVAPADGRFLLCSDGLSRSLDATRIRSDAPLTDVADQLMAEAIERDGSDNVSFVLIDMGDAGK